MSIEKRVEHLEDVLIRLCEAIPRMDTDRDGHWGYPSVREEVQKLADELRAWRAADRNSNAEKST